MVLAGAKQRFQRLGDRALRVLTAAGVRQSQQRLAADAHAYWSKPEGGRWKSDSHRRDSSVFTGSDLWATLGERNMAMVERSARAIRFDRTWDRVVEWGCGGGANAIHFAPRTKEFIGIDGSQATLDECERQIEAVRDTQWTGVLIRVADPEAAVTRVPPADLWLCYYVFELIPSREYGERLLNVAHRMLAPGGLAHIQIKYTDGTWASRPRMWRYRSAIADMTAYRIDEFWDLATRAGFVPELVELRPKDELDKRYAYFTLLRP